MRLRLPFRPEPALGRPAWVAASAPPAWGCFCIPAGCRGASSLRNIKAVT